MMTSNTTPKPEAKPLGARHHEQRDVTSTPTHTPGEFGLGATAARLGTWRVWIPTLLVFLAFFGVFFSSSAAFAIPVVEKACGQLPLDVRFYSTGYEVSDFLDACGQGGRDAYRNMQVADLLYPLVFGLFMASSLSMVLRRLCPGRPGIAVVGLVLAMVGTGFDYLENLFAWLALAAFPQPAVTNGVLGVDGRPCGSGSPNGGGLVDPTTDGRAHRQSCDPAVGSQ